MPLCSNATSIVITFLSARDAASLAGVDRYLHRDINGNYAQKYWGTLLMQRYGQVRARYGIMESRSSPQVIFVALWKDEQAQYTRLLRTKEAEWQTEMTDNHKLVQMHACNYWLHYCNFILVCTLYTGMLAAQLESQFNIDIGSQITLTLGWFAVTFHTLILKYGDWLHVSVYCEKEPQATQNICVRILGYIILRSLLQLRIMRIITWPWAVVLPVAFCDICLFLLLSMFRGAYSLIQQKYYSRHYADAIAEICRLAFCLFGTITMLLWISVYIEGQPCVHIWRWMVVSTTLLSAIINSTKVKWKNSLFKFVQCIGTSIVVPIWIFSTNSNSGSIPIMLLALYISFAVSGSYLYKTDKVVAQLPIVWVVILLLMCCFTPLVTEEAFMSATWFFPYFCPMFVVLYEDAISPRPTLSANIFLVKFPSDPLISGHVSSRNNGIVVARSNGNAKRRIQHPE